MDASADASADASVRATAITLTADNDYLVAVARGSTLVAAVGSADNALAPDIVGCPLGMGPEQWPLAGLPAYDTLYVWGYDDSANRRGLLAQLETAQGPRVLGTGDAICASGTVRTDPMTDLQTLIASCDAGTASASGGWSTPMTGDWGVAALCPGIFDPAAQWFWWSDGTGDPLDTDVASSMVVVRVAVVPP